MIVFIKCCKCVNGYLHDYNTCLVCDGKGGKLREFPDWRWDKVGFKPKLRLHCMKIKGGLLWRITWEWGIRKYGTPLYRDIKKAYTDAKFQMMYEFRIDPSIFDMWR